MRGGGGDASGRRLHLTTQESCCSPQSPSPPVSAVDIGEGFLPRRGDHAHHPRAPGPAGPTAWVSQPRAHDNPFPALLERTPRVGRGISYCRRDRGRVGHPSNTWFSCLTLASSGKRNSPRRLRWCRTPCRRERHQSRYRRLSRPGWPKIP